MFELSYLHYNEKINQMNEVLLISIIMWEPSVSYSFIVCIFKKKNANDFCMEIHYTTFFSSHFKSLNKK